MMSVFSVLRRHRFGRAVCLGLLVLGLLMPSARGDSGITLTVNQIDDSRFPDLLAYVTVTDGTGLPIAGIPAGQFAASEDGRPLSGLGVQPLVNEGRSLAVVLALDVSGSMSGAPLAATQGAAKALAAALGPQDTVAILAFNKELLWLLDFTPDRGQRRRSP